MKYSAATEVEAKNWARHFHVYYLMWAPKKLTC